MAAASTLSLYEGRVRLARLQVYYVSGRARYRAQLANGEKVGTFRTEKAAWKAINAKLAERAR